LLESSIDIDVAKKVGFAEGSLPGGGRQTRWRGWFCIAAVVLENLSRFSHEGFCSMVTEFLILFFFT